MLDWNATLVEINVLRNTIRLKGENYVGILGKASDDELGARDRAGLERLSHGIFDDEDGGLLSGCSPTPRRGGRGQNRAGFVAMLRGHARKQSSPASL